MTDTELPSQRTIEHKNIQKKIKPGTKNDRLLLESVKYVTMKHCRNGVRQCGSSPRMFWWDQAMHLDKEAPDGASDSDSNAGKE